MIFHVEFEIYVNNSKNIGFIYVIPRTNTEKVSEKVWVTFLLEGLDR